MIRPAVPDDRAGVVALLEAMHREAGSHRPDGGATGFSFGFRTPYADRLFALHLDQADACCLVLDLGAGPAGMLLARAGQHLFGPVKVACETCWYIAPDHRGRWALRMIDAYEAWAQARGCQLVDLAGMGADPAVAVLYRRRGFRVAETHFVKAL